MLIDEGYLTAKNRGVVFNRQIGTPPLRHVWERAPGVYGKWTCEHGGGGEAIGGGCEA